MMNDQPNLRQALRLPAYEEALAEHLGMNVTDLRCLEHVLSAPGLSAGRLAELSGLTTGAVTGVLDRLERAGWVAREADPDDRRGVVIRPVAGRATELETARAGIDRALGDALDRRDPAQRDAILAFLREANQAVTGEAARLRAISRGGFIADEYVAPLAGADRGRLVYASGAPRISLNIAPLGPEASARIIMESSASRLTFRGPSAPSQLMSASFDGPRPDVSTGGGEATIRYRRKAIAAFSSRSARVALNPAVPWSIELSGGITDLTGTLDGVHLERLELEGGANHVDLDLPAPMGSALIRIRGVASSARFRRPAGVPVAVRIAGGVSHLRIDGARHERLAGDRRFTSDAFTASSSRYEIEILGGASEVTVET